MAVDVSEDGISEDLTDASSDNEDEPDEPLQPAAGEAQAAQRRQHLRLFNREQYLRRFEEHINELKRVGDPEFALQHCTFLKSAEIEGHALFCAWITHQRHAQRRGGQSVRHDGRALGVRLQKRYARAEPRRGDTLRM